MSQFADECEVMSLAVRLLDESCNLPKRPSVLFLKMRLPDWRKSLDPPEKLLRMLDGLPFAVRPGSRAEEILPRTLAGLPPTHRDRRTGEVGYLAGVGVSSWRPDGAIGVGASIRFAGLAGRGFSATAVKREHGWVLEHVGMGFS